MRNPFFTRFPYTNLNDINLDWIIKKVKILQTRVDNLDPEDFAERLEAVEELAEQASTDASAAVSTANSARTQATSAQTTATNAQTSANNAQDDVDALEYVVETLTRPNLLDNWYFVSGGGFPINQRGQSSYTSAGYGIDRWKKPSGLDTISTSNTGILIETGSGHETSAFILYQLMPQIKVITGVPYTISILVSGIQGAWAIAAGSFSNYTTGYRIQKNEITTTGLFSATGTFTQDFSDMFFTIRLFGGTGSERIRIKAVKFEMGDTQTLAHQVGNEWVLNAIPNHRDQLSICRTYFLRVKSLAQYGSTAYGIMGFGSATTATRCRFFIPIPESLRAFPSMSYSGNLQIVTSDLNVPKVVSALAAQTFTQAGVFANATSEELTAGSMYYLRAANESDVYIDLSAEP